MFDFLFNPKGRISRKGMWLGFLLPYIGISFLAGLLEGIAPAFGILTLLIGLFYFWPNLVAVPVKRLHDHGKSGWWLLAYYAAVFTGLILVGMAAAGTPEMASVGIEEFGSMSEEEATQVYLSAIAAALRTPLGLVALVLTIGLGLFFFVYLYVVGGQPDDNRFGRDPLASGRGFAD